jgi:biopolymer transport protein ExbD
MKFASGGELEKLEMNMTPMIDVCFQLIIFFMLSLRLYSPEGDFSIKMPLTAIQEGLPDEAQVPPVKVRMHADQNGNLSAMEMGQRPLKDFKELRFQMRQIAGLDRGPAGSAMNTEVELDCDYELKFEHVVSALTAISGYMADDKQSVVRMVEKIKFAPPRRPKNP